MQWGLKKIAKTSTRQRGTLHLAADRTHSKNAVAAVVRSADADALRPVFSKAKSTAKGELAVIAGKGLGC